MQDASWISQTMLGLVICAMHDLKLHLFALTAGGSFDAKHVLCMHIFYTHTQHHPCNDGNQAVPDIPSWSR